ncbi:DegT/DnrJ/EryC1/StrS family aminotransferase [Dechloromonas denitrificans]|uniref:DegT/DnrJ/EryC1/StrS family aminotransferase n=1 Tax=Dechloromonas denitrificans TaxID=281362 RepID=UPI001CF90F04|nr:DegT/DnrJ/EryC1/StrS family aminotransferase [Dechloromonas denitrificans]UCV01944.1 DegT/DnrJ/EryC1/StrS aminotransferase family protein [Dechloromonas denitrificans]
MPLDYWIFDPSTCQFPKPRVPILPSTFDYSVSSNEKSAFPDIGFRHFSRGRYALGEAFRLAGVGQHGALLAPAYHCVTMLDPALALGAPVLLYSLKPDLMPDLHSLDQIYAESTVPVKALLATHFFGLVRDFSRLKQWADDKGIVLVEDCSHVLFTERYRACGAGLYGKFIASSPYKFFPCTDGGLLAAQDAHFLDGVKTESAGLLCELRGIKSTIEKSRLPKLSKNDLEQIDRRLDSLVFDSLKPGVDQRIERSAQSIQYSPASATTASLLSSRWLTSHSSATNNLSRRQENYRRWVTALSDVPNCHVLYPEIPAHAAPYMFPLYLNYPTPHFYWLKLLGLPVWRWDEMVVSDCAVAEDYRLHLLHLPCHQSLSEDEMGWMVAVVRKTLALPVVGVQ